MRKLTVAVALMAAALPAGAKVSLNPMVGDNMVLQQSAAATLWGTAAPGTTVEITPSWSDIATTVKADKSGKWKAEVETPKGSFNKYSITFTDKSDNDTVRVSNVLTGEVWLASGQSNMQMPLKGYPGCCVKDGYDEIAAAGKRADSVRFITVPLTQSYTPLDTVASSWQVPSSATAPEFSALCWALAGRMSDVLGVPVGIVSAAYGGAKVESWLPREILEEYDDVSLDPADIDKMVHYYRPMLMYNAMFVPLKDYTYKGILWYQGCSNTDSWQTYADRLATMVSHWRQEIGEGDIPFYAVEIGPFDYNNGQAAYLREAQWDAIDRIPNSGMISITDLVAPYERFNIHPEQKKEVGNRLCNLILNQTYGHKEFPVKHPRFKSLAVEGNKARVTLDVSEDGICRNYGIEGFELAGEDRQFHPAKATSVEGNDIILVADEVDSPRYVRYCFGDFKLGNVYGGNYLPLIPFRSDR